MERGQRAARIGRHRASHGSLVCSLLLGAGGLIGLAINGSNVKIRRITTGSIVGVTLAFMGLVYYLLPRMGFGRLPGRLATLQPAPTAAAGYLRIAGLPWSGGYGVQRKAQAASRRCAIPSRSPAWGLRAWAACSR